MTDTATAVPAGFIIPRWPQDDEELYWFTQAIWGTRIPRHTVCPGHCSPFQAFAEAFFARESVTIWKASRGFGGKTQTLSTLVNTEAVCLAADSSILGGSAAQSLNVHAASIGMWHHHMAPRYLLRNEPTKYDTWLNNGAYIRSLMASQASVRGPHPQRLRLDEIDEMDVSILEAAQGQPMRKKKNGQMVETQTVMSSTHQYPDKTMKYALDRAAESGWPVREWCWRESANPIDGWLTMDEVERKRKEIPPRMWDAEYDLQEPSFEGRSFDPDAIERTFDARFTVKDNTWALPGYTITPDRPVYITSVDWARKKDWTVIATFDTTDPEKWYCVELQVFQRLPWPMTVYRAEQQYARYGGPRGGVFIHDSTGLGDVVSGFFNPQLKKDGKFLDYIMGGGRARLDLFSEYISAVEDDQFAYPRMEHVYNEHKFTIDEDLYGSGHPPDSVVCGALAWAARHMKRGRIPGILAIGRESSPWDLSAAQPTF